MQTEDTIKETKKSKGKTIAIVLLGLLLAGSAVSNFQLWKKETQSTQIANSKLDSIVSLNLLKDSLYAQLEEEQQKVSALREELAMFQGNNDSLQNLIAQKEQKISSLRSMVASGGGNSAALRSLKDSIFKFKTENNEFKSQVTALNNENNGFKSQLSEQELIMAALKKQKEGLSKKVEIASQPYLGPINVTPEYTKKGIFLPQFKAKKVERLKITYDILANQLTQEKVKKEIAVRIIDPDGLVLSNNNNSLSDINKVYTDKKDIEFDGKLQKINVNFIQKPSYKKGKYKVELKDGETIVNTNSFELI